MAKKHHNPPMDNNAGSLGNASEAIETGGESDALLPQNPGDSFATTPRTGADVIADLAAVKLRIECEQARWDALADELGRRAKSQGATRNPVRIAGTLYDFHARGPKGGAKTYSLIEAREPGEIK